MAPAEKALRDENHEVVIAKRKKVIAATKSVFVALLILSFFSTAASVAVILDNQEAAADRILDCVVPAGGCYQAKIKQNQQTSDAEIIIIVNYCYQQHPESIETTRSCVQKELSKR
jgi:hypothetical protein